MTAEAAPSSPVVPAPIGRRRFARWRPSVALGSVVAALISSQFVALAILFAAGGDDAPDWVSAATIVIADGVLLTVVVLIARKGADKLAPATFGIAGRRSGRRSAGCS